jgi:hypothetical protein
VTAGEIVQLDTPDGIVGVVRKGMSYDARS